MEKIAELKARLSAISGEMTAIVDSAESGVLSEEQQTSFDALKDEHKSVKKQIDNLEALEVAKADAEKVRKPAKTTPVIDVVPETTNTPKHEQISIPATVRRGYNLKAFKQDDEKAYAFGQWVRAACGNKSASDWCNSHGVKMSVHNEGTNSAGGYLVPIQFDNNIISLVTEYGTFRRNARIRPMASDTLQVPRRDSGLTAYWTAESAAATESDKSWSQVELRAKKLMAFTRISNELNEDAIVSIADDIAVEIARAFAYAEDVAGWTGTGLATQGSITGVTTKIKAAAGTPTTTSAGGVIVANDKDIADINLASYNSVVGKCPVYARANAKWYASPFVYEASMAKLMYAGGGNTTSSIGGGTGPSFLGYPVELVEVLPATDATSQILVLFGDLSGAASFGDRRNTTIAFDTSLYFNYDQIAVKGTERLDIVVHDVGNTTTAGPIVALQTLNA